MAEKKKIKKLKIGDEVNVVMFGGKEKAEVIKVLKGGAYKVKLPRGTVLSSVTWLSEKEKKKPFWYIDSVLKIKEEKPAPPPPPKDRKIKEGKTPRKPKSLKKKK